MTIRDASVLIGWLLTVVGTWGWIGWPGAACVAGVSMTAAGLYGWANTARENTDEPDDT